MRRTASDLLVALALVHGADHLAGGQVVQDPRVPGNVVAVVQGGLPYRNPSQNRGGLRRTRFEANTRRIPPRTPAAVIRAAIHSSTIAAAFSSPWFTPRQRVRAAARRRGSL